jgi:eukaryotic-like serine/threonine-protein kinase
MTSAPVQPGQILAGKYQVERVLGRGGMGVVLAVRHMATGGSVALKVMTLTGLPSGEAEARFFREARIAGMLKSQHAGKVRDCGKLEDGSPYIEMDLLEGQDLSHLLKARGALTVEDAVSYVLQACEAVAEAHASGIVHRDLKPANLFLATIPGGGQCVKVLDFGISKLEADDGKLTQTDQTFGSPLYMSPELIKSAKHVDGRADVWALGVILYELLAEATPFAAESVLAVSARVLMTEPSPLSDYRPDLPGTLVAVVMQCLEKDPARRWQNVADFAAALAPYAPPDMVRYVDFIAKVRGVHAPPSRSTDMLPPEPKARPVSSPAVAPTVVTTATRAAERPRRPLWPIPVVVGSLAAVFMLYFVARALGPTDAPVPRHIRGLTASTRESPPPGAESAAEPEVAPAVAPPVATTTASAATATPIASAAPSAKPPRAQAPRALPATPARPKKNIYED